MMKKLTDKQNENELNCLIIERMQFDATDVLSNTQFRSCLLRKLENQESGIPPEFLRVCFLSIRSN